MVGLVIASGASACHRDAERSRSMPSDPARAAPLQLCTLLCSTALMLCGCMCVQAPPGDGHNHGPYCLWSTRLCHHDHRFPCLVSQMLAPSRAQVSVSQQNANPQLPPSAAPLCACSLTHTRRGLYMSHPQLPPSVRARSRARTRTPSKAYACLFVGRGRWT